MSSENIIKSFDIIDSDTQNLINNFLETCSSELISKITLFFWTIFITVGIWRSAEAYTGKFIWVVLTLIVLCYRIFTLRILLY